ncbi:MAG TPA: SDR family NAD(P)-dependent oxidoreductase [Gemmatimonadaceae bacterium]|nr:SDR family NAD(P)-dependent oxidoreductase [Gemmatimonadaceae bacterium]
MAIDPLYLTGKHCVVTGGGRGIGAAVASELARLGAAVTIMGRDPSALAAHAAAMARERGSAEGIAAVHCDVTDEGAVVAAFEQARETFGDPYALVNNAGQAEAAAVVETRRETWDRLLAVNLTGAFLCTQQVLPAMLARREGRVVNVASTAGLKGYTKMGAYCASKHGLVGLTRALALETAKAGVTANAVCPGYTDTDMAQLAVDNVVQKLGKSPDEALKIILRQNPRGTLIAPAEVASAVAWLCSPGASAVTGQAIVVAAGEL